MESLFIQLSDNVYISISKIMVLWSRVTYTIKLTWTQNIVAYTVNVLIHELKEVKFKVKVILKLKFLAKNRI